MKYNTGIKKCHFHLYFPHELDVKIRDYAFKNNMYPSYVVTLAVKHFLGDER